MAMVAIAKSQKGIITIQQCSTDNKTGSIIVDSLWR